MVRCWTHCLPIYSEANRLLSSTGSKWGRIKLCKC